MSTGKDDLVAEAKRLIGQAIYEVRQGGYCPSRDERRDQNIAVSKALVAIDAIAALPDAPELLTDEPPLMPDDQRDTVDKALGKAWQLGQQYWRQVNSQRLSEHRAAAATQAQLMTLIEETRAILTAAAAVRAPPFGRNSSRTNEMTDRELLEGAAKAAKLDVRWYTQRDVGGYSDDVYEDIPVDEQKMYHRGTQEVWNPLENEGDAFRLATELELDIRFHISTVEVGGVVFEKITKEQNTRAAAARRAIVYAAALRTSKD